MLITARNARFRKKIEMGAQRSSIWEVQKQICSTKEKSTDSKSVKSIPWHLKISVYS